MQNHHNKFIERTVKNISMKDIIHLEIKQFPGVQNAVEAHDLFTTMKSSSSHRNDATAPEACNKEMIQCPTPPQLIF